MELESSGACVLVQRLKYVLDYVFCTACMLACTAGTNWNYFSRYAAQFVEFIIYILCSRNQKIVADYQIIRRIK